MQPITRTSVDSRNNARTWDDSTSETTGNAKPNALLVSLLREKMQQLRQRVTQQRAAENPTFRENTLQTITTTGLSPVLPAEDVVVQDGRTAGSADVPTTNPCESVPKEPIMKSFFNLLKDDSNPFHLKATTTEDDGISESHGDGGGVASAVTSPQQPYSDPLLLQHLYDRINERSQNRIMVAVHQLQTLRSLAKHSKIPIKKLLKDCTTILNVNSNSVHVNT
uniref:Transcription factor E3 n=1 Tax=Lygus hesperus TaxID=30085 RepID=A0A0A9Z4C5_LYGHE